MGRTNAPSVEFMIIKKVNDIPAVPVTADEARKVRVRVVFGPKDGAPTFAMRLFEVEPGGCTPHHAHPFEHEIMILEGNLTVAGAADELPLGPGDALMLLPGETHQLRNLSPARPARFLCMVPVEYQK